jgi:hypothetical protein
MISIDGVPISLTLKEGEKELSEFAKFYIKKRDEILKTEGFFPRRYVWHPTLVQDDPMNKGRIIQPTERPVNRENPWIDSKGISHKVKIFEFNREKERYVPFNGSQVFEKGQIENVILFEYLSPRFNKDFVVHDPMGAAIAENMRRKRLRDIEVQIFDTMPEDELRTVASAYQVGNAVDGNIELIKKQLFDTITFAFKNEPDQAEEVWRGRSNIDDKTKLRATIQQLVDEKVVMKVMGQKPCWKVNTGNKTQPKAGALLCAILGEPFESLVSYLAHGDHISDREFLFAKLNK